MYSIQQYLNRLYSLLREGPVVGIFERLREDAYDSRSANRERQLNKLNALLTHAYRHVPYYRERLEAAGLARGDEVRLESFEALGALPILTKEAIREHFDALCSDDHGSRQSYRNSSGGSTGSPIVVLQDAMYDIANRANFFLVMHWRGFRYYEPLITIWGASRDTFGDRKPWFETFKDFCRNRIVLNSYRMTEADMRHYIDLLNRHRPKLIIAYAQSIYEIAVFARKEGIEIVPQQAIHAAAGSLYEFMRETVEAVFGCRVYNHYGSRESGAIASECSERDGLHILMDHTYVEIVDAQGNPAKPGEQGHVVITTLNNFSMPLIRYRIGDIATMKECAPCACGCTYPKLHEVIGRSAAVFKTVEGGIVNPVYFAYLIRHLYERMNIETYQVIQKRLDHVLVKIVKRGEMSDRDLDYIRDRIRTVMTQRCGVEFEFVESLPKTATGKFDYNISEIG